MPDCPQESTLEAFFNGLIDSESKIDHICTHLDDCPICQKILDSFEPSGYEDRFRNLLMSDVEFDEHTQCTIDEHLASAEALSKKILQSVSPPTPTGENKKERFRPEERIGTGHFFRCLQVHDLWSGLSVAVKIPIQGYLTSTAHHIQFLNDCHGTLKLKHPNIVPTLDFGRWDESRWFISTELVQARPLEQWLNSANPTFEVLTQIFSQLANGLHYAHENNVIHRHLDTRNVLVTDDHHVWITDFGFVLDQRYQFDLIQIHKEPSSFLPKELLSYSSSQWLDERSDIYSLGQLMEYCLKHDSVVTENHGLAGPLSGVAQKCAQWSRGQRYQSVQDVIADIQNLSPSLSRFGTQS